tara:strand:- start:4290 stop:4514 length:225 start_codon:yes stop_codon:yes gene_type:complete
MTKKLKKFRVRIKANGSWEQYGDAVIKAKDEDEAMEWVREKAWGSSKVKWEELDIEYVDDVEVDGCWDLEEYPD